MDADLHILTWYRDFCLQARSGVQAIPDHITRTRLPIAAFGGEEAPWAHALSESWNAALDWRRNEATVVAKELLIYAQSLDEVARDYQKTDDTSSEDIARYEHG